MIKKLKKNLANLSNDPHMLEIAKGTALAFALKVMGAGLAFGFNVALARLLGAEGSGLFFLALSFTTIGSVVGRIGLDSTLLRFTARYATDNDWEKVRSVNSAGKRLAIITSSILALFGFILAEWLAENIFGKSELAEPLKWMSLALLPFAVLNLQAESLKGLKKIKEAMLIQGIGIPLIGLIIIWPLTNKVGVEGAALSYLIATIIVAISGSLIWNNLKRIKEAKKNKHNKLEILESCKPLFISSLMNRAILPWSPLFLLGIWASATEVGIFGAASRVSLLISFLLVTINNVIAPKFAEFYAKNDIKGLGSIARKSAGFITMLASPLFIFLFIFSEWTMKLFGEEFSAGSTILTILIVGQLISSICGSVGYLLIMTGNEKDYRNITIASAIIQTTLILILAPLYGGIGAAVATTIALATVNISSVILVKKRLNIYAIPGLK